MRIRRGPVVFAAAFLALAAQASHAANVDVNVACCTFSPAFLEITEGDTVTWHWTDTFTNHTVTSGKSSAPGDMPGSLFDASLSSLNPTFAFTFSTAGTVPYFCRPHELLGMKGTIV